MNDHNMLQMDVERHSKAILDSLEELIAIAGKDRLGYHLVQNEIPDLNLASIRITSLIDLLKLKPALKVVP